MVDITISGLERSYGSYKALKGVSLDIKDQEFVVLLGPSGCGKTTLLRAIAGLDHTDKGTIHLGERNVTALPARERGIAMVFQNYAVFPHMTVYENVAFGLRMKKAPEAEIVKAVGEASEMMRIGPYLQRYPAQLSGGQRQRVSLARALAVKPAVLLMDEPLSNLDALLRLEMRAELKSVLAQSRTTTVYVTHDQVEAMGLADRVAVMQQGEIIQYEKPMDIYAHPASTFVAGFIGNPPMNLMKTTRRADGKVSLGNWGFDAPGSGDILLGVRAEELDIVEPGAAIDATVKVVEPLGPSQLVTIEIDGQMARVDVPNATSIRSGQKIALKPKAGSLRWFNAETGQRV
ncbi:MAG: ABC transporter ATP-binding protein [Beijerinckiaceae bacterium]